MNNGGVADLFLFRDEHILAQVQPAPLRDASFNIVCYDSRFDTYRGFRPPHLKSPGG